MAKTNKVNTPVVETKIEGADVKMTETKKVVKKARKANVKDVRKAEVMAVIEKALLDAGFEVKDGVEYGMTKGTIIVGTEDADVQIKPISPKAGLERYQKVVFED